MADGESKEIQRLLKEKRKAERTNNLKELTLIYNCLGEEYTRAGNHLEAIEQHKLELHYCEALADTIGTAVANRKIGECYSELGRFKEAISHQKRHLHLAKSSKSEIEEQRAYATIGRTYLFQAEMSKDKVQKENALSKAESAFTKSLEVCVSLKKSVAVKDYMEMKCRLLLNLGLVYDHRGNIQQCSEYIKQAINLAQKQNLHEDLHRCQYSLALIYVRGENFTQALRFMETAYQCAQKMRNKDYEREAGVEKAMIQTELEDLQAARRSLKKAYKLAPRNSAEKEKVADIFKKVIAWQRADEELKELSPESTDHGTKMKLYERMGDSAAALEKYRKALKYYHKMLDCAKQLVPPDPKPVILACVSLAQTYIDVKEYKKAVNYYKEELQYRQGNFEQQCRTWLNIGEALDSMYDPLCSEGDSEYRNILKAYRQALDCAKKANHRRLQVTVLKSLSIVQARHDRNEEKEASLRELSQLTERYDLASDDEVSDDDGDEEDEEEDSQAVGQDIDLDNLSDDSDVSDSEEFDRPKTAGSIKMTYSEDFGQYAPTSLSLYSHFHEIYLLKVYYIESQLKMAAAPAQTQREGHCGFTLLGHEKNHHGETPLHRACIEKNLKRVKKLIEMGHPVNPRDNSGWIPLHEAANHGQLEVVRVLIDAGAWINDRGGRECGGVTPLLDAASCGNVDIMDLLLRRGANIYAKDDEGNSVLSTLALYRRRAEDSPPEEILKCKKMEKRLKTLLKGALPKTVQTLENQSELYETESQEQGGFEEEDEEEDLPALTHRSWRLRGQPRERSVSPASTRESEDEVHLMSDIESSQELVSRTSNRNARNILSDDDEDSEVPYMDPQQVERLNTIDTPSDARSFYDSAIAGVRSAATTAAHSQQARASNSRNSSSTANKKPALIDENSYVGDDWLEEDVRPSKRQRRDIETVFRTGGATRNSNTSQPSQQRKTDKRNNQAKTIIQSDNETSNEMDVNDIDAIEIDSSDYGILSSSSRQHSNRPVSQKPRRSRQLKLTTFTSGPSGSSQDQRIVRDDRTNGGTAVNEVDPVTGLQRPSAVTSQLTTPPSNQGSNVMRLRVKINNKTLLVPVVVCDEGKTIGWLAEEAARRYFNSAGMRPHLTLQTVDGATLANEDLITCVLSSGEEVLGIVNNWEMAPLQTRYAEFCKTQKIVCYKNVKSALQSCEGSNSLSLCKLALRPNQLYPVLRAVHHHQALKELILKGNRMGDSGVKSLTDALETLQNITLLDISGNDMTSVALQNLADMLESPPAAQTQQKPLQYLDRFHLDLNPLGDGCTSALATLVKNLPKLTWLGLKSCDLTLRFLQQHRILAEALQESCLQRLDVSLNKLGSTGVELLLKCLRPDRLLSLDLSGVVSPHCANHTTHHLDTFLSQSNCILEELSLADCQLGEDHVAQLMNIFSRPCPLQRLDLSFNPKITNKHVTSLLDIDSSLGSLRLGGCGLVSELETEFVDAVTDKLFQEKPLRELRLTCERLTKLDLESLEQIWKSRWADLAQVKAVGDCVELSLKDS